MDRTTWLQDPAAREHGPRRRFEPQRKRRQCLLCLGDGFGQTRTSFEKALRQAVAQPDKRDLAEMNASILCIEHMAAAVANDTRPRGGIEEFGSDSNRGGETSTWDARIKCLQRFSFSVDSSVREASHDPLFSV
jgi:hypothetical protein